MTCCFNSVFLACFALSTLSAPLPTQVLEKCQGAEGKGKLSLTLRRGSETREVVLDIDQKYGTYAAT